MTDTFRPGTLDQNLIGTFLYFFDKVADMSIHARTFKSSSIWSLAAIACVIAFIGCAHTKATKNCDSFECNVAGCDGTACGDSACHGANASLDGNGGLSCQGNSGLAGECNSDGKGGQHKKSVNSIAKDACGGCCNKLCGWCYRKSNAVPQTLPLGSTVRAFDQVMETNAEATDFIFHRNDFVTQTARLTPDGRDKIIEVAARMPNTPFPILVERSENNSNPELDALRRALIARILTDLGNEDAQIRTVVAPSYGPGYTGREAERTYYQSINNGYNFGGSGFNNGGNFGTGIGGGFGGGF
ncbi:hypothetical protein AB1L42_14780 [Thalassoglobus sp. JC818]|uniref:hypothetical protein n=1 Tax=Thalassoglobus sp. JC818 TaxID=3232136 RepID=UPI00345851A5